MEKKNSLKLLTTFIGKFFLPGLNFRRCSRSNLVHSKFVDCWGIAVDKRIRTWYWTLTTIRWCPHKARKLFPHSSLSRHCLRPCQRELPMINDRRVSKNFGFDVSLEALTLNWCCSQSLLLRCSPANLSTFARTILRLPWHLTHRSSQFRLCHLGHFGSTQSRLSLSGSMP